jgi:L-fuconolactonase
MIIDAHQHLWRIDQGYDWLDSDPALAPIRRTFSPADLQAELAAAGVDRSVLVEGGRCDPDEAALLFAYAAATPPIAGVVAWADPAALELPAGEGLVGIRAQVQAETVDYLDRADVRAGLRAIAAAGLAFDLVIRADQLPSAGRLAHALPDVRLVLDHLGKPPIRAGGHHEWAADLAPLAAAPTVTAKLSGLVTEADWRSWTADDLRPYVETAVDLFGPERLMFGSDWPVCLLASSYRGVKEALSAALPALTAAERAEIFGGTAARAYRLT